MYYGKDIVQQIMASPRGHEIGLHAFSHVPFSECSHEVAEAEIKFGLIAAAALGLSPSSFVFPYNKVGHIDVLKAHRFKIYRSQDLGTITDWGSTTPITGRILHRLKPQPATPKWRDGIWEIASSIFALDNQLHLPLVSRAKIGLQQTVRRGGVFHLCLHPHDLLFRPALCRELDQILDFVCRKRERGELLTITMGQLAEGLNQPKVKSEA